MFKAIIDWLMANYEMYLLVGIGFALLDIYGTLKEINYANKYYWNNYKINAWGIIAPILIIPLYPVFIIIWLLNKLAQWE